MWFLNRLLTGVFDVIYAALDVLPRWASLTLLSCAVGLVALFVVKYCSNQRAIGRVKNDIKANMLAIKLFKDELGVMFQAQRRLIWAALRMQYHMLPPLLVMLVPLVLMAAQMGLRHQWRPLRVGEETLLTARIADPSDWKNLDLVVPRHAGFDVFDRVRAPADGSVTWRLRARSEGVHAIAVTLGNSSFSKELAVGEGAGRVCPTRPAGGLLDEVLYPAEEPFRAGSPVQSITVRYPLRVETADAWYAGADWWILWFLVVSMAFALILKPILKVKF